MGLCICDPALSFPVFDHNDVGSEENPQQNKREEKRRKQRTVEMIHVNSHSSMESQCAQQ